MLKPGDKIAVIDDNMEGRVVSISGGLINIETDEGFLLEFEERELVKIDSQQISFRDNFMPYSEVIREKEGFKKKKSQRVKPKDRNAPPLEVDLHIEKLVNSFRGMTSFEILNLQMETAKRQLEFAMQKRIQKVVFIHGVGEGVLKAELDFMFGRYDNINFYDADYAKYGSGATEVYILQNA